MTEANRKLNSGEEWSLGEQAWQAAEVLRSAGLPREAVGRYYYAAFHSARAALLTRGVEPRTHTGVAQKFSELFVKDGLLSGVVGRVLGRLQQDRERADYARDAVFAPEDAEEARATVLDLRSRLQHLLQEEGWM